MQIFFKVPLSVVTHFYDLKVASVMKEALQEMVLLMSYSAGWRGLLIDVLWKVGIIKFASMFVNYLASILTFLLNAEVTEVKRFHSNAIPKDLNMPVL